MKYLLIMQIWRAVVPDPAQKGGCIFEFKEKAEAIQFLNNPNSPNSICARGTARIFEIGKEIPIKKIPEKWVEMK